MDTSGLLAAAGFARLMKETPGRLLVIGMPAEERGKTALLEGGALPGGRRRVFHRPHPSPDADKGAVVSIRKWLEKNGVKS